MAQENTILIVDDLKSNLILLDKVLTDEGYKVISATNGDDAIKLTQQIEFDLILLDIMMPKKDGFALFEELKSNKKTATIPVIFITVLNNYIDTLKAFKMGAVDYITKPFTPTELRVRIRTQIALVNARKSSTYNLELSSDTSHDIEHSPFELLNIKLNLVKKQIQEIKHSQFSIEEKANLDRLKTQATDILKLLKRLTK